MFREATSRPGVLYVTSTMSDAGGPKRPSKVRATPLGERFVLVTIADHDEPTSSLEDRIFRNDGTQLSEAERAVAELAARGLTNSEIAQARGVANRTISNQLAVVYRKLGVSGRRELRAWFRQQQSGSMEGSS